MAHLDVFPNGDPRTAKSRPYVLDVQNNILGVLPSTIVVPLARPESIDQMPVLRLNPKIQVGDEVLVMLTQDMAAIPRRALKSPILNISTQRDEILAALDFLFTGF
jgi:toxin CcdB